MAGKENETEENHYGLEIAAGDKSNSKDDNHNEEKCNRRRCGLISYISLFITLFLVGGLLSIHFTYGYSMYGFIGIFGLFILNILIMFLILNIIYFFYYICSRNINKKCNCRCCKDYCNFIFQFSFCTYACQLSIWYCILSILLIFYHPFWKGKFEIEFIQENQFNSKGITLRPWPQTMQYTGKIYKPNNKNDIINIITNATLQGIYIHYINTVVF